MKLFGSYVLLLILSTVSTLSAQSANNVAAQAMAQARSVLTGMVQANSRLTPEFVRMGFHDCVGGCDGCIDLADPNNFGLEHPISVLDPIVQQFATAATGLSRADIWALAAMVGADAANHGQITQPINFTQNWFGRVNCENANSVCLNANGQSVPCSETAGPHRVLPSVTFNSPAIFSYFASNFGFNERQTVAIMGAHTCGRLLKNESGIDSPHGWTINNVNFDNEYYNALMGAATALTPDNEKESVSPNWVRFFEDNTGTVFPSINRWELSVAGLNINMLDADVALVRNLNASNSDTTTGAVSCTFNPQTGTPACDVRPNTIDIAAEFSDSNDLWLSEFNAAYDLMLTNGYNRIACTSAVCPLTTNRIGPPSAPVAPTSRPTPPPAPLPPVAPVRSAPSPYVVPTAPPPIAPSPYVVPKSPVAAPPVKMPTPSCISSWQDCTSNTNGCCAGSTCVGNSLLWLLPKTCQPVPTCIPRGGSCSSTGCCSGTTCQGWLWLKQCM